MLYMGNILNGFGLLFLNMLVLKHCLKIFNLHFGLVFIIFVLDLLFSTTFRFNYIVEFLIQHVLSNLIMYNTKY